MSRYKPEPRQEPDQLRRYQREIRLSFRGSKRRATRGQLRRILLRLRRECVRLKVPIVAGKGTKRGAAHFSIEWGRGGWRVYWAAQGDILSVKLRGWRNEHEH